MTFSFNWMELKFVLQRSIHVGLVLGFLVAGGSWGAMASAVQDGPADQEARVQYNRDVRPILSDNCFLCHGNDSSSREADLRLDRFEDATAEAGSGEFPIVPGDAEASELIRRITSTDEWERMPPESSHRKPLTADQVETLKRWIDQGAEYQPHWAFIAPKRPAVPDVSLPAVDGESTGWGHTPIDSFVLRKLAERSWKPSPEADRATLIRRVSLDLTGLPPTQEEVAAFVADPEPQAYERLVDRLLASPRYGEHMARYWLDAVRYGDTHGLHLDNYREVWPYRDWVIRSFNDNLAWDQFTIKQLAGDLLPQATVEDRIASGYNRMHVTTSEGGSIAEEVFVRNVVDRVSTTGIVFMGLTLGCAVCHDHKYDPISAEDFYSLYAFFNSLDQNPLDQNAKDHAPVIKVLTPELAARLAERDAELGQLLAKMDTIPPEMVAERQSWIDDVRTSLANRWTAPSTCTAESKNGAQLTPSDENPGRFQVSGENPPQDVYTVTTQLPIETLHMIRLQVFPGAGRPEVGGGRSPNGNAVLTEFRLFARERGSEDAFQPVRLAAAYADHSQANYPITASIDGELGGTNGWAIEGHVRAEPRLATWVLAEPLPVGNLDLKLELEFSSQFAQHAFADFQVSFSDVDRGKGLTMGDWYVAGPVPSENPQAVLQADQPTLPETFAVPGEGLTLNLPTAGDTEVRWERRLELKDGPVNLFTNEMGSWYLFRRIYPVADRLRIKLGSDDAVAVWLNGQQVHRNNVARGVQPGADILELDVKPFQANELMIQVVNFGGAAGFAFEAEDVSRPALALLPILSRPETTWDDEARRQMDRVYLYNTSEAFRQTIRRVESLEREIEELRNSGPTTLVSMETDMPRPAFLLQRGEYDKPDQERGPLPRKVPDWLPPLPTDREPDRLALAQWLVGAEHPLLARVTVNRFWQQVFGTGLVKTSEDFGLQGTWPTHPELLDWLAVDFRENGWDVKRFMKQLVLSATYRQQSAAPPESWQADPTNRWLARGPRHRLDAETLRDQALQLSGLLVDEMGGASVKPPQPDGLWKAVGYVGSNTAIFVADKGHEKIHRRSLYSFWKRTAPPPQLSTFDAPSREECVVRRERTNTPLQALLMLNDPQYVECANALAAAAIRACPNPESPAEIADWLMRQATLRSPTAQEIETLVALYEDRQAHYSANYREAEQLLSVGELPMLLTSEQRPDSTVDWAAWALVANVVLNLDEVVTKQ